MTSCIRTRWRAPAAASRRIAGSACWWGKAVPNNATTRGREPKNRWIGLRLENPAPNIAKLAEAQGAVGIGPVTKAADVKPALEKGVAILKKGGVCVIDFPVDPPPERAVISALGHRETGY